MADKFEAIILSFIAKYPTLGTVLLFLGAIIVIAKAIIDMTPTKEDDEWYDVIHRHPIMGRVLKFVAQFAPLQPKESK